MLHEHLDSRFLFPTPLLPLGDFLMKFSEQSLFPVSVRGIEKSHSIYDMKIIMHNKASGIIRGCKEGSQAGLTIPEVLATLSINSKQQAAEIHAIDNNDQQAIRDNQQAVHNQITLDAEGFVRLFQRIVTPLSGYNGKVIALSTISLELTQYTNLLFLLELYKQYYEHHLDKERTVTSKILDYLKLDAFFEQALTLGEITALFAMVSDVRHKQAATLLHRFYKKNYSPKTISNYASLIQDKLKPGIDIHQVLYNLRDYYQRQPMMFENER